METVFILNSSPIISLSKAGLNTILGKLNILVPQDVALELSHEKYADEARQFINAHQDRVFSNYLVSDEIKSWGLGNGESSVLAVVFQHRDWIAVIDDGAARKCAKIYNLNLTGTLGLLLIAYNLGVIPNVQDAIDALKYAGLYLHDDVINNLLQEINSH
jgi:predicted nucleic acid-binding protein